MPNEAPTLGITGATGEMGIVGDTVRRLTGHEPQILAGHLANHLESYRHLLARV
jgi:hypothetical protein